MIKAEIVIHDSTAGCLTQTENEYHFVYDTIYLGSPDAEPVSLTLPLKEVPYTSLQGSHPCGIIPLKVDKY